MKKTSNTNLIDSVTYLQYNTCTTNFVYNNHIVQL